MSSIPTAYNGINFRSRAEARWAAFFDFAGWEWEYEPIDLDGYIPDFVVRWKLPLLVEVKGGALDLRDLEEHKEKVEQSGWKKFVLLVGAVPERGGAVGLIGISDDKGWIWRDADPIKCGRQSSVGLTFGESGLSWCQRCNLVHDLEPWSTTRDWSDACNATQWMPGIPRMYAPRIQAPR